MRMLNFANLFEAKGGLHISIYLKKDHVSDQVERIKEELDTTERMLKTTLSKSDLGRFLAPLKNLINNRELLSNFTENIAIFRNTDIFRIVSLPELDGEISSIATSFHIKPLLTWMQKEKNYFFLGIDEDSIYLYKSNLGKWTIVDATPISNGFHWQDRRWEDLSRVEKHLLMKNIEEMYQFIKVNVLDRAKSANEIVYIAGDSTYTDVLQQKLDEVGCPNFLLTDNYKRNQNEQMKILIGDILQQQSERTVNNFLKEYQLAKYNRSALSNIFDIGKASADGTISKLIISGDKNIFGKVCHQTGRISINPPNFDHEDDCILDDIAQMVIEQKGEVLITNRNQLPMYSPALAIMREAGEGHIMQGYLPEEKIAL